MPTPFANFYPNYIVQKNKNQQTLLQKKSSQIHVDLGAFLEQDTGIEPATVAWEATVFPLN